MSKFVLLVLSILIISVEEGCQILVTAVERGAREGKRGVCAAAPLYFAYAYSVQIFAQVHTRVLVEISGKVCFLVAEFAREVGESNMLLVMLVYIRHNTNREAV